MTITAEAPTWEHTLRAQPAAVALRTHQPIIMLSKRLSTIQEGIQHQRTHIFQSNSSRSIAPSAAAAAGDGGSYASVLRVQLQ
jgi:hypothetical protein